MEADDTRVILEALFDIRSDVRLLVRELLEEEDGPGEEEED